MKKLIVLSWITFILSSCSSDNSDGGKPGMIEDILLKKTITTFNDGSSVTANYTYQDKDLTKIEYSDGRTADYIYEEERLVKVREYHNGDLYKTETFVYSGSKIVKATTIFTNEEQAFQFLFEYDNNEIDISKYVLGSSGYFILSTTGDMTMNSVNISEIIEYELTSSDIVNNYTFTYDVKNNPFRNISANEALVMARQYGGINNPTSFIRSGPGAAISTTMSYTYDENDFPITSVTTQNGEVTHTEYFYE